MFEYCGRPGDWPPVTKNQGAPHPYFGNEHENDLLFQTTVPGGREPNLL